MFYLNLIDGTKKLKDKSKLKELVYNKACYDSGIPLGAEAPDAHDLRIHY